jgi:hypothetical protein
MFLQPPSPSSALRAGVALVIKTFDAHAGPRAEKALLLLLTSPMIVNHGSDTTCWPALSHGLCIATPLTLTHTLEDEEEDIRTHTHKHMNWATKLFVVVASHFLHIEAKL